MPTILIQPGYGLGHFNACLGMGEALHERGHNVIFVVTDKYVKYLDGYGFQIELLEDWTPVKDGSNESKVYLQLTGSMPQIDKARLVSELDYLTKKTECVMREEPSLKRIVEKTKPDVFIIDHFVGSPTLIYSNKPWVRLFSANPLGVLGDYNLPPYGSGFPTDGDKNSKEWKEFFDVNEILFKKSRVKYNEWLEQQGFPIIEPDNIVPRCIPVSPYLNLYGFPVEVDYTYISPISEKWLRVDTFSRKDKQGFQLPETFNVEKGNKVIYFSMGTSGGVNIELMERLLVILAKAAYKFIVSKGPRGDKLVLADNMWGENYLPQVSLLPLVDLVITHGGNNTVTETLNCGKPMIIMPLFSDQYDNAQRIQEKGFGVRLDPHTCSQDEVLHAIDSLLNDKNMKKRLSAVSQRMKNSKSLVKASEMIEKLVN